MSLPTPPSTSRRDKENQRIVVPGSRVAWSVQNEYHSPASSPTRKSEPNASKVPTRSILKKTSYPLLPLLDVDVQQREPTPDPVDALSDSQYLESPVSNIIASSPSLRDLVEAYSVLTARIKSAVSDNTTVSVSWPLFQPLKKNLDLITNAIIRDLGRAFEESPSQSTPEKEHKEMLLPSPKSSPKRKIGMTEEQVKHARDLCTTCHAVLKLLGLVLTLPTIYKIFNDTQLHDILTHILAIPLASSLPTQNARKTYALAIWVLQVQRLPVEILYPARHRITEALQRGIEGKLGKEGKKGSASDGLKAVHDLCVNQPATFTSSFIHLLPPILSSLLAPALAIRMQACHALGGFAIACTTSPQSHHRAVTSEVVAGFLVSLIAGTEDAAKSPQDSTIFRTLRMTLMAEEPQHVAQGPIWGLCVLANFIVLIGPALKTNSHAARAILLLLNLARRHKRSSVRALACVAWRCLVWTYYQPPLQTEDHEAESSSNPSEALSRKWAPSNEYWAIVVSELELGMGATAIAGLFGNETTTEEDYRAAFQILDKMIGQGGFICSSGVEALCRITSLENRVRDWNVNMLLPRILFVANPGLLTSDLNTLSAIVKPVVDDNSVGKNIRPLTRDEIVTEWIFDVLVKLWKKVMAQMIVVVETDEAPPELVTIWESLLKARVSVLQDENEAMVDFGNEVADILISVLQDSKVNFTDPKAKPSKPKDDHDGTTAISIDLLPSSTKLFIIHALWKCTRAALSYDALIKANGKLLESLVSLERSVADDARHEWASFCVDVLLCNLDAMEAFWEHQADGLQEKSVALLWKLFVDNWRTHADATWEGSVFLLGVPFVGAIPWELNNDSYETWEELLRFAVNKGLDFGADTATVLDHVAEAVSQNRSPAMASFTRVVDLLLTHLDISDARQVPDSLFAFVNDVMVSTYPPEPRNKITSMWMIRSFTRALDACPRELCKNLLEMVRDGLCVWLRDEHEAVTQDEYSFNILPLYQTILVTVQSDHTAIDTLEKLSNLLHAPFLGRSAVNKVASEAFHAFWQASFATVPEPADGWSKNIQLCLRSATIEKHAEEAAYDSDSSDELDLIAPEVVLEKETSATGKRQQTPEPRSPATSPLCKNSVEANPDTVEKEDPKTPFLFTGLGPSFVRSCISVDERMRPGSPNPTPKIDFQPKTPEPPSCTPRPRSSAMTPKRPKKASVFTQTPLLANRRALPSLLSARHPAHALDKDSSARTSNKENMSPNCAGASVEERTTQASPGGFKAVLGKRRPPEDSGDERPKKKGKAFELSAESDSDSDDERVIVRDLFNVLNRPDPAEIFTTPSRKIKPLPLHHLRKGIFMDAVELPTLRRVKGRKQQKSPSPFPLATTKISVPTLGGKPYKRTRPDWLDNMVVTLLPSRKTRINDEVPEVNLSPVKVAKQESSDDDPHIGQVTPHHLLSPTVRQFDRDPPSDEPVSSPLRDIAARRSKAIGAIKVS